MAEEKSGFRNVIIGFVGRKWSGKSRNLTEFLVTRPRVIVVDPNGEHDWSPNEIDSLDVLREFVKANKDRRFWAANYVPGENIEEDVAEASRIIFKVGDCTVAFDEITEYCSAGHAPKPFSRLIRRGRHRGIDIFYTSLRFAETPRRLTAQTDQFFLFKQAEPSDLDGIAARCGVDVAALVDGLDEHEYIKWDIWNGVTEQPERQVVPAVATESKPGTIRLRIVS